MAMSNSPQYGWNTNNPFGFQSFARGGVVLWSDPHGNQPTAAEQYTQHLSLPDVAGIAGVISRQRIAQQELQQQSIKDAMAAANKVMQQRQSDQIGQYLLANDPDTANDPLAQGLVNAGAHPMQAYQMRKQAIADESDAQQGATDDYYKNLHNQAIINHYSGLGAYGEKLTGGTAPRAMTPRQQVTTANDYQNAMGDAVDQYDLPNAAFSPDNNLLHPGPNGTYQYTDEYGNPRYVTQDYLQQARTANDAYKQAQANYRQALSGSQAPSAGPSISQNDVNQAQEAGGKTDAYSQAVKILQDNGKPITDANVQYVMKQIVQ